MPEGSANQLLTLLFPILIIVFFIFAIIIPQRKKDKAVRKMLSEIKSGDKIRTIGGLYGKVVKIDDKTVTLEVGPDKVRMPFVRSAIATVDKTSDVEADSLTTDSIPEEKK